MSTSAVAMVIETITTYSMNPLTMLPMATRTWLAFGKLITSYFADYFKRDDEFTSRLEHLNGNSPSVIKHQKYTLDYFCILLSVFIFKQFVF